MPSLTRYVLKQTLMLTLAFTLVFSAAVWLVQSLRLIDLIVNRGLSLGIVLHLALLIFPRFVEVVLPIAIFLAVLFSFNRLISESELVVMRTAGLSQIALARPALILAGLGALLLLVLVAYLLPFSNREFKDLQFDVRNRYASALIQEGVFNTLSDRLTVYVRTRDRRGELGGLLIQDSRDPRKPVTIFAERGAIVNSPTGPRVLMVNGTRQEFRIDSGKLSVATFDSYTLDINSTVDAPMARIREPEELYITELLTPSGTPERDAALVNELHQRLLAPFGALVFTLIPLACLLPGDFNRRGQGRRILAAIAIAIAFEVFDLGGRNLAARSATALPLLYFGTFLPIGVGFWLLRRDGGWPWLRRHAAAAG
ncbi:MAG TPA: LPS export ABC transporter permease LptF [Stellaceae bacterium]|nr:LPS export ABC transporter permease LptF [Stellaceae bacterium]